MLRAHMARAKPEAGVCEPVSRVVVCVAEGLRAEVFEALEAGGAAFAGQEGEFAEGEGELLLDFEEGLGRWDRRCGGAGAGGEEVWFLLWGGLLVCG